MKFKGNVRPSKITARLKSVQSGLSTHPATKEGLLRAGEVYVDYVRREYRRNMAGGGKWAPLAKSTIKGREAKGIRNKRILYATGAMYSAVRIGGGLTAKVARAVLTVSFDLRTKLGRRMWWHHWGLGNYPARKILVEPDKKTRTEMARVTAIGAKRAARALLKQ